MKLGMCIEGHVWNIHGISVLCQTKIVVAMVSNAKVTEIFEFFYPYPALTKMYISPFSNSK